jgi:glycosyltransferase involved in cell wall biosynthesis
VERLGLGELVRVVEPTDDVQALYGAADVFVSTSRIEGQPFAVIESILSGLPVVAVDLAGHRDICGGLESCRVVAGSPEAIAAAVAELQGRPDAVADSQREAAREAVKRRFDLAPWTEAMLDRYQAILARTDPAGAAALKPRAH